MPISGNRHHPLAKPPMPPPDPDYVEYGVPFRFLTYGQALDQIALAVARLPTDSNPTQRKRLRIIARELMRRARA